MSFVIGIVLPLDVWLVVMGVVAGVTAVAWLITLFAPSEEPPDHTKASDIWSKGPAPTPTPAVPARELQRRAEAAPLVPASIWDDVDVAAWCVSGVDGPELCLDNVVARDRNLATVFLRGLVEAVGQTPSAYVKAGVVGVMAAENYSGDAPVGYRKFTAHEVGRISGVLWDKFGMAHEAGMLAAWTTETIEKHRWLATDEQSALNSAYNLCQSVLSGCSKSLGADSIPTAESAREAAREWLRGQRSRR